MTLSVEVREASVSETRMRYCRFGSGNETMVILPGLTPGHVTDSAQLVAEGFASFAGDFTVYLFDIEENVPKEANVSQLAESTYTVMESLGLSGVYLYGASLGGMLSVCIDAEHPGFVAKMALASTLCKADATFCTTMERWIATAEARNGSKLLKAFASDIYSGATLQTLDESFYISGNDLTENDFTRFVNTAQALSKFDILDKAQCVSAETLLAWSRGDRIISYEAFIQLANSIKGAKVQIYSEAFGHAVYDEAPNFRERMREFFLQV